MKVDIADVRDLTPFYGVSHSFGCMSQATCNRVLALAGGFSEKDDQFSYGSLGLRNSRTCLIKPGTDTNWLYKSIWSTTQTLNSRFRFSIDRLEAPLQLIRYEHSQCVDWHIDCGGGADDGGRRKLSLTFQLSDGATYGGGDLEFLGQQLHPFVRTQGTLIAFPSFLTHRVTPIEFGTRYSLVVFVEGTPFR